MAQHAGLLLGAREGGEGGDGAHVEGVDEDLVRDSGRGRIRVRVGVTVRVRVRVGVRVGVRVRKASMPTFFCESELILSSGSISYDPMSGARSSRRLRWG